MARVLPALEALPRALSHDLARLQGGGWARTPALKPSRFPHRPPTIAFRADPEARPAFTTLEAPATDDGGDAALYFSCTAPQYYSCRIPLLKNGFRRVSGSAAAKSPNVALGRPYAVLPLGVLEMGPPGAAGQPVPIPQKMNHFPGSGVLGSKGRLADALARMQQRFGSAAFGFAPETYVLPQQWEPALAMVLRDQATSRGNERSRYILKPVLGSCGRGIRVLDTAAAAAYLRSACNGEWRSGDCVLQRVIEPMLVTDRKWDMRLYVLVTSFDPLSVYLFADGLVRFASQPYNPSAGFNAYADLTNFSINRRVAPNPEDPAAAAAGPGTGSQGIKWSVQELTAYLRDHPSGALDHGRLWADIRRAIVRTLIGAAGPITEASKALVSRNHGAFEIYGFDIMVDADHRPWVLEVNILPSMESSSSLDYGIKSAVVTDTLNMLLLRPYDRSLSCHPPINPVTVEDAICQFADADHYRGGFERIFPTAEAIPECAPFFTHNSRFDAPLWDWILGKHPALHDSTTTAAADGY